MLFGVEKVGAKKAVKAARLADRVVTAVVKRGDAVSGEDLVKLYRSVEGLLAAQREENDKIAELLKWARTKPRSWLAAELRYELSNLAKVLAGKIQPRPLLDRILQLRERTDT